MSREFRCSLAVVLLPCAINAALLAGCGAQEGARGGGGLASRCCSRAAAVRIGVDSAECVVDEWKRRGLDVHQLFASHETEPLFSEDITDSCTAVVLKKYDCEGACPDTSAEQVEAWAVAFLAADYRRMADLLEDFASGGETGCPSYAEGERDGEEIVECATEELERSGMDASPIDALFWDIWGTCSDSMVEQHEGCGDYALGLVAEMLSALADMVE